MYFIIISNTFRFKLS